MFDCTEFDKTVGRLLACLAENGKNEYRKNALANHNLLDLKVTTDTKQIVGRPKRYNVQSNGNASAFGAASEYFPMPLLVIAQPFGLTRLCRHQLFAQQHD
jgi:hypothetical protein